MARVPYVNREDMDAEGQQIYTAICMAQVAFKPEMEPGKQSTL
jgi:hypothetical protein